MDQRIVLLLDLDCFYASAERVRLGFTDHKSCCLAVLQWDSCLAVSYPAREFGIKRGDGFQEVQEKSKGKCMAVHVPLLETDNQKTVDFSGDYASVYELSAEERKRWRAQDIGRRRYASEGKACLERYRVASRRIFELVMECLGITSGNNNKKAGLILEKASIDEFFVDVTDACDNPNHCLWETVRKYYDSASIADNDNPQEKHNTVMVGLDQNETDSQETLQSNLPLDRGCQLAHYIRHYVFLKLGFTLSAGISINKMMAKLATSYGKPNGQAVVLPDQVSAVMHQTKLSAVRNFGGKLGLAIIEQLPDNAPHTMGAVAKYFSLPQLQDKFGHDTAKMILQASRGEDNEAVEAKNSGNVVKSITAFKSLPRSLDADIEDASLVKWLYLLVTEVVNRVEADRKRNTRYPRNCTIHYGCHGQVKATGKPDMKSLRIAFPPKRLEVAQRISQLMESIPKSIIEREAPNSRGKAYRKPIRLIRMGVCATEMNEEANKQGSIANYFSAAGSPNQTKKNETQSQSTQKAMALAANVADSRLSLSLSPSQMGGSVGWKQAKDLHSSADQDKVGLDWKDENMNALDLSNEHSASQPLAKQSPSKAAARGPCRGLQEDKESRPEPASEDEDLALARRLQASYDREHSILGSCESSKRRSSLSGHGKQGGKKKAKTSSRKISSFFGVSK